MTLWTAESPGPPGAPLVAIVHGSMDRSASFAKVARALSDCHVVRYDRRGYGRSMDIGTCDTIADHVDDLFTVLDGRRADVVIGHSIGGVIALAAAARDPDAVRSVVAYEAPTAWLPWWPDGSAGGRAMAASAAGAVDPTAAGDAAERFMRGIVGDPVWERLPSSTRAARRAEGMALVAELRAIRATDPPPYDPAEIAVPVIAAHGTEAAPHHAEAVRTLAARAPHAVLRVIEGAGHGVHRSDPEALATLAHDALVAARR